MRRRTLNNGAFPSAVDEASLVERELAPRHINYANQHGRRNTLSEAKRVEIGAVGQVVDHMLSRKVPTRSPQKSTPQSHAAFGNPGAVLCQTVNSIKVLCAALALILIVSEFIVPMSPVAKWFVF